MPGGRNFAAPVLLTAGTLLLGLSMVVPWWMWSAPPEPAIPFFDFHWQPIAIAFLALLALGMTIGAWGYREVRRLDRIATLVIGLLCVLVIVDFLLTVPPET